MMASSISLKELSKALNAFIPEPTLPLPDHLIDTISAYLKRHEKYDDAAADRLQDELLSIHDKYVKDTAIFYGAWMAVLRRLLPVLGSTDRIIKWFDVCHGMLSRTDHDRVVVDETIAVLTDLLTFMDDLEKSSVDKQTANPILDRLIYIWIERIYPACNEGKEGIARSERILREALGNFGKKKPKDFFMSLDTFFVNKQHRKAALRLLCDFIQSQPPHLYQMLQTNLFSNLLTCLRQDTSTTVVSGALTAVIMLLPHMPSSLVPYLPNLFNIYARLLFWERERSGTIESPSEDANQSGQWDICAYDATVDELLIAHLPNYYTILYGLYPINFMDYIRKPQRYMRHANVSGADEIEVQPTEIRHQSERFRQCHLQHPNFYTLTIESEKTDFSRWIKSEVAEVVAECMSLCVASEFMQPVDHDQHDETDTALMPVSHEETERDRSDPALLSGSLGKVDSWRNSHFTSEDSVSSNQTPSTMVRRISQSSQRSNRGFLDNRTKEPGSESPMLPQLALSPSRDQLQDMIQSNKAIKSGLHQSLANDSVPSLSLSHQESIPDKPSQLSMPPPPIPTSVAAASSPLPGNALVSQLQGQISLLQNDLNFERYLKQQHMAHIGDLRRKQVEEAATEAETQNLIMMNRHYKRRYEEAKRAETQVRKESEKSRALAKKWEADLATKIKNLRDESKKSHGEIETIKGELVDAKQECEKLRNLVCEGEVKELHWKQNMQSIEIHGAELDYLKGEVERLQVSERDHQARELERQAAGKAATEAQNETQVLKLKLAAQGEDIQRTKALFEGQVAELQSQLSEAREEGERPGTNTNLAVESALAASRAKQADMQKHYALLMRKYTALQSSLLDMHTEASERNSAIESSRGPEAPTEPQLSSSASPVMMKSRPHRLLSNPDAAESGSYNMTSSQGSTSSARPNSPPIDATDSTGLSVSPEHRQLGSEAVPIKSNDSGGSSRPVVGFQHRLRRESKDKQRDDGNSSGKPKKEKKSSGLRGIRGFV